MIGTQYPNLIRKYFLEALGGQEHSALRSLDSDRAITSRQRGGVALAQDPGLVG